jgi:hypothetical protein
MNESSKVTVEQMIAQQSLRDKEIQFLKQQNHELNCKCVGLQMAIQDMTSMASEYYFMSRLSLN